MLGVELGAGTGSLTRQLAQFSRAEDVHTCAFQSIVAFDASPHMLSFAQSPKVQAGQRRGCACSFVVADNRGLPLATGLSSVESPITAYPRLPKQTCLARVAVFCCMFPAEG